MVNQNKKVFNAHKSVLSHKINTGDEIVFLFVVKNDDVLYNGKMRKIQKKNTLCLKAYYL